MNSEGQRGTAKDSEEQRGTTKDHDEQRRKTTQKKLNGIWKNRTVSDTLEVRFPFHHYSGLNVFGAFWVFLVGFFDF